MAVAAGDIIDDHTADLRKIQPGLRKSYAAPFGLCGGKASNHLRRISIPGELS